VFSDLIRPHPIPKVIILSQLNRQLVSRSF
jgi:hypothetical protein